MDETEFAVMRDTMLTLYGMCFALRDKKTGRFEIIEPKRMVLITRSYIPHEFNYQSLEEFCLNAKLLELSLKADKLTTNNDDDEGSTCGQCTTLNRTSGAIIEGKALYFCGKMGNVQFTQKACDEFEPKCDANR